MYIQQFLSNCICLVYLYTMNLVGVAHYCRYSSIVGGAIILTSITIFLYTSRFLVLLDSFPSDFSIQLLLLYIQFDVGHTICRLTSTSLCKIVFSLNCHGAICAQSSTLAFLFFFFTIVT